MVKDKLSELGYLEESSKASHINRQDPTEFASEYPTSEQSKLSGSDDYSVENLNNPEKEDRIKQPINDLNISFWDLHMKIRGIAEEIQYSAEDLDVFWNEYSTKEGFEKILVSLEELDKLGNVAESRLVDDHLDDVKDHAYNLIEYKLSSIMNEEYGDWPGEDTSFGNWPAADTLDFIRSLSENSVEYEAYSHLRSSELDSNEIGVSDLPDISDLMP